jgi:predicted nucleotidyltransferase
MRILDEKILDEMKDRLVNEFDPDKVILFGSHAWGKPTEFSDTNKAVIIFQKHKVTFERARDCKLNCVSAP